MLLMYFGTVVSSEATMGGWLLEIDVQSVVELHRDGEQFSAPMETRAEWIVPEWVSGSVVVITSERGRVLGVVEMRLA